jgi:hypothetical protein
MAKPGLCSVIGRHEVRSSGRVNWRCPARHLVVRSFLRNTRAVQGDRRRCHAVRVHRQQRRMPFASPARPRASVQQESGPQGRGGRGI